MKARRRFLQWVTYWASRCLRQVYNHFDLGCLWKSDPDRLDQLFCGCKQVVLPDFAQTGAVSRGGVFDLQSVSELR